MTDEQEIEQNIAEAIRETERHLQKRHGSFVEMLSEQHRRNILEAIDPASTFHDALYERVYGPINIQHMLKEHTRMSHFDSDHQTVTIPRETLLTRLRERRDEYLLSQHDKDRFNHAFEKLSGDLDAIAKPNLVKRLRDLSYEFDVKDRDRAEFAELERLIDVYELATDESYTFPVYEAQRLLNS